MRKSILMAVMSATVLAMSCEKDNDSPTRGIQYGTDVTMGNGKARSFFEPNDQNHPVSMGISIDEAALENLPAHETFFILPVPDQLKATTPYDHISLDWTPHGHEPGVYSFPHFDMHFYMISQAEQQSIDVTDPELQILPDSTFMPPFYVPEPGGVPQMGKHWVDITSPELNPTNPLPFTTTLVYGTYNGKVIFHEPMMTRAFLLSKPDTVMDIRQPLKFSKQSHYPTKYQIRFDNARKDWRISLQNFEHR